MPNPEDLEQFYNQRKEDSTLTPEQRDEINNQAKKKLEEIQKKLTVAVGDKHFFTINQLNDAFGQAENITAAHFNGQTCSMLSADGNHECPICFFRIQVKKLLGVD
jgi:uracil-DNA glycosylase